MRGPNPFDQWGSVGGFVGRKEEIEELKRFLGHVAQGKPFALLFNGLPGSGKSTLLHMVQLESGHAKFFAPVVGVTDGERFETLLTKISAELQTYSEEKSAEKTMAISERVVASLRSADKADFPFSFARIIARHTEGLIIMIDDANRLRDPERLGEFVAGALRKAEQHKIKLGFVITCTTPVLGLDRVAKVMSIHPLQEHDLRELISFSLKKGPPKMGEECIRSIVDDSQGSPLIAQVICRIIYEKISDKERIITKGHYLAYLPAIMSTLGREFFDRLYGDLPNSERGVLKAFAEEGKPAYISDIARKIGKRHATTLALRLTERGQLTRVDRGLYKVFTKLYGRYVMERG